MNVAIKGILALVALMLLSVFPVSAAELIAPSESPAVAAPKNNPFSINTNTADADGIFDMYLYEDGVCTIFDKKPLTQAINALPKLSEVKTLSREKCAATVLKVERFNNFTKYTYELRPGELRFGDKGYALSEKQYTNLLAAVNKGLKETSEQVSCPFWFTWMNPERVTKMSYIDKTGATAKNYTAIKENLSSSASGLQWQGVTRASQRYEVKQLDIAKLNNGVYTVVEFDSGVVCRIFIDADNLYVECSGVDYGYKYLNAREAALSEYKSTMQIACTKPDSNVPGYTG